MALEAFATPSSADPFEDCPAGWEKVPGECGVVHAIVSESACNCVACLCCVLARTLFRVGSCAVGSQGSAHNIKGWTRLETPPSRTFPPVRLAQCLALPLSGCQTNTCTTPNPNTIWMTRVLLYTVSVSHGQARRMLAQPTCASSALRSPPARPPPPSPPPPGRRSPGWPAWRGTARVGCARLARWRCGAPRGRGVARSSSIRREAGCGFV